MKKKQKPVGAGWKIMDDKQLLLIASKIAALGVFFAGMLMLFEPNNVFLLLMGFTLIVFSMIQIAAE